MLDRRAGSAFSTLASVRLEGRLVLQLDSRAHVAGGGHGDRQRSLELADQVLVDVDVQAALEGGLGGSVVGVARGVHRLGRALAEAEHLRRVAQPRADLAGQVQHGRALVAAGEREVLLGEVAAVGAELEVHVDLVVLEGCGRAERAQRVDPLDLARVRGVGIGGDQLLKVAVHAQQRVLRQAVGSLVERLLGQPVVGVALLQRGLELRLGAGHHQHVVLDREGVAVVVLVELGAGLLARLFRLLLVERVLELALVLDLDRADEVLVVVASVDRSSARPWHRRRTRYRAAA